MDKQRQAWAPERNWRRRTNKRKSEKNGIDEKWRNVICDVCCCCCCNTLMFHSYFDLTADDNDKDRDRFFSQKLFRQKLWCDLLRYEMFLMGGKWKRETEREILGYNRGDTFSRGRKGGRVGVVRSVPYGPFARESTTFAVILGPKTPYTETKWSIWFRAAECG